MRLMRALIGFTALTVLLLASSGIAVAGTGEFSVGSFSSSYSAGALHVQFTLIPGLGIYDWIAYSWPDVPGVVEVVRHGIADPCGTETHVAYFLWNQQSTPFVTADITDAGVQANTTYEYLVYGYAQAVQMAPVVMAGFASTGPGFLCHATLSDAPDCGVSSVRNAISCDNECAGWLLLSSVPSDALQYFNTATTLAIYGEVDGLSPALCNVVEPVFKITSVLERSCVTAVEPVTWGAVKAMYK